MKGPARSMPRMAQLCKWRVCPRIPIHAYISYWPAAGFASWLNIERNSGILGIGPGKGQWITSQLAVQKGNSLYKILLPRMYSEVYLAVLRKILIPFFEIRNDIFFNVHTSKASNDGLHNFKWLCWSWVFQGYIYIHLLNVLQWSFQSWIAKILILKRYYKDFSVLNDGTNHLTAKNLIPQAWKRKLLTWRMKSIRRHCMHLRSASKCHQQKVKMQFSVLPVTKLGKRKPFTVLSHIKTSTSSFWCSFAW